MKIVQKSGPRERLLSRAGGTKILPTPDPVVLAALRLLSEPSFSFEDLCRIVKCDGALSSKIISIANSAFYSRGVEVVTVERAALLIGYEETTRIITSIIFVNKVLGGWGVTKDDLISLFRHSLYVAYASRELASRMLLEHPEKAFAVSLLHDVGKLVLLLSEDGYGELMREAQENGEDLVALERERLGIDHAEVGAYLSKKWRLPQVFAEVIGGHHAPGSTGTLAEIVSTSDRFYFAPSSDLGDYGFLLLQVKEKIEREMDKTEKLLGL